MSDSSASSPVHASAVAIDGQGLLITGASGSGKSLLALQLVDRGAQFIGDDQIILTPDKERLLASPAPALAGRIEIRNLGILPVAAVERIPLALVIALDEDAPRWIEQAEEQCLGGISLPLVRLDPKLPALPLRAEWALAHYGR